MSFGRIGGFGQIGATPAAMYSPASSYAGRCKMAYAGTLGETMTRPIANEDIEALQFKLQRLQDQYIQLMAAFKTKDAAAVRTQINAILAELQKRDKAAGKAEALDRRAEVTAPGSDDLPSKPKLSTAAKVGIAAGALVLAVGIYKVAT